jgi:Rieske Fe-S protein
VAGRSIDVSAAEVPAEGALVLPQFGVAVVRDGPALAGIDLTCTHLGCTVTANAIGFTCPCHGSCFSCRGERLSGPATHSLRALRAEEENGVIHVANDGSVTEIAAERRVERS